VSALPYPADLIAESQSSWLDIVTETEVFFVDDRRAVIEGLLIAFPEEALTPQTLPHAITLPGRPAPRLGFRAARAPIKPFATSNDKSLPRINSIHLAARAAHQ
jgi:hypothetical protein